MIARCPKCSYLLVFLEKRQRYKCAKCGRMFYPNFIDNREFREWNQRQRGLDREALNPKKRIKLTEEERKERIKACQDKWMERNIERLRNRRRAYESNNKEKFSQYKKLQRKTSLERVKLMERILYLRKEQKKLVTQMLYLNLIHFEGDDQNGL